jgi:hypothetical protein
MPQALILASQATNHRDEFNCFSDYLPSTKDRSGTLPQPSLERATASDTKICIYRHGFFWDSLQGYLTSLDGLFASPISIFGEKGSSAGCFHNSAIITCVTGDDKLFAPETVITFD